MTAFGFSALNIAVPATITFDPASAHGCTVFSLNPPST